MLTPVTSLRRLYRNNSTAKALLDHWATRERNREETHFERMLVVLSDGDQITSRSRLREVFRSLERLGYGHFIIGRHGHPTRFIHTRPLIELGEEAQVKPNPRRSRARHKVLAQKAAEKLVKRSGRRKIAA